MKFLYTARNKEGQVKQGVVVASSQEIKFVNGD
jgi:type II secretory pathway component PulF